MRRPLDGELVPDGVSETDVRDEVNRRTALAGYTTRYGERTAATRIQNVVGFGKEKLNVWPRDARGRLIGE